MIQLCSRLRGLARNLFPSKRRPAMKISLYEVELVLILAGGYQTSTSPVQSGRPSRFMPGHLLSDFQLALIQHSSIR